MSFHMILEGGVLKAVPLQEKPITFNGEIHANSKLMGSFYPCRGVAVEIVSANNRAKQAAASAPAPVIQQAEPTDKIALPKHTIELKAPVSAFATATIAFDEPDEEPEMGVSLVTDGPAIVPVSEVAQSLATEDARGVGITQKEFNQYQLKGAQVRKLYEILIDKDSAEVGVSNMTKALVNESGKSPERGAEILRAILDVKRGAL